MLIYLDNSATTKPYEQVIDKMMSGFENYGNPSSLHRMGLDAEKLMKASRLEIAKSLGSDENEIVFTGSGTEADSLGILGAANALKRRGNKIITTRIEHKAVLENCNFLEKSGFKVVYLDVDEYGLIDLDQLESELDDKTILVSVMLVNNEIGSIQPIRQVGKMKSKFEKILFHTDAVQAYGKIQIEPRICNLDMVSISGHKIHGPKGIGALDVKKGVRLEPVILGGAQERGLRSGTENIPAIMGFAEAAKINFAELDARYIKIKRLKDYLINGIRSEIDHIKINGPIDGTSSPYILNISFLGTKAEVLLHMLEDNGIFVSTGSACTSRKNTDSHVLKAMGLKDKEIQGALRFSFSEFNDEAELDFTIEKLAQAVKSMRKGFAKL
ncbi:MAG: cysteine desulfurase family protein [Eubacteriales bacterium]